MVEGTQSPLTNLLIMLKTGTGAASLQEAGALYPPAKFALKLQIDETFHFIEAPDQRSF